MSVSYCGAYHLYLNAFLNANCTELVKTSSLVLVYTLLDLFLLKLFLLIVKKTVMLCYEYFGIIILITFLL